MEISLRWHHQKGCNDHLAIEHQPNELNVVVAILFPQIIRRYVRQLGQPLVYPDFIVFGDTGEVLVLGDLLVDRVELLVVGRFFVGVLLCGLLRVLGFHRL